MNAPESGRLCVILCTERSGSTLLSVLLGGHTRVLAPPETHLFRWATYEEWAAGYPMVGASLRWLMEQLEAADIDPDQRFAGRSTAVRLIPSERRRKLLDWVEVWADQHQRIEDFLSSIPAERHTRVQFEALVSDPEATLASVCGALGLELQPTMLEPNANIPDVLVKGIGDYKIAQRRGIEPNVSDAWRASFDEGILPADVRRLYERLTAQP